VTSGETGDWAGDDIDEPTLLPPEESLDEDERGDDLGAGYSPV